LRGLVLRERRRVVQHLRRGLDRDRAGPGLRHADEDLLLLGREALDRPYQIRDQVRAALVLVDYLGPAALDVLVLALQRVVAAAAEARQGAGRQHNHPGTHSASPGGQSPSFPFLWLTPGSSPPPERAGDPLRTVFNHIPRQRPQADYAQGRYREGPMPRNALNGA